MKIYKPAIECIKTVSPDRKFPMVKILKYAVK